jgi:hypothetical protein
VRTDGYSLSGYTDRDGDGLDLCCLSCPMDRDGFPHRVRRFTEQDMDNGQVPLSAVLAEADKHDRTAGHR